MTRRIVKETSPVTIGELITPEMADLAIGLYPDVTAIQKQVIEPNMDYINRVAGQANDPRYIAYVVVSILSQALNGRRDFN